MGLYVGVFVFFTSPSVWILMRAEEEIDEIMIYATINITD